MINVKNKSPIHVSMNDDSCLKKSPIQPMDVRHEDVLVVASLILVDREAEADGHQLVLGETAGGRVAQHRAGVLVGILPAELLQQDVALLHLSRLALLTLHSEGLALLHHTHNLSFHRALTFPFYYNSC